MSNDFFSIQSNYYALYRPTYPDELYKYIEDLVEGHELAWDVATGNGQAAVHLAGIFMKVYASDLSQNQLNHAVPHEKITYVCEPAEHSSLEAASVDLITVATALHWFDLNLFYQEVERVLKPGGILYAWSYGGCRVEPAIDAVIDHFNFEILFDYWHPGARLNWHDKYESIHMPYPLLPLPSFVARAFYTMEELVHYMYSWSGLQAYIKQHGQNPVELIADKLAGVWGDPKIRREIKWYLHGKCCRKPH